MSSCLVIFVLLERSCVDTLDNFAYALQLARSNRNMMPSNLVQHFRSRGLCMVVAHPWIMLASMIDNSTTTILLKASISASRSRRSTPSYSKDIRTLSVVIRIKSWDSILLKNSPCVSPVVRSAEEDCGLVSGIKNDFAFADGYALTQLICTAKNPTCRFFWRVLTRLYLEPRRSCA